MPFKKIEDLDFYEILGIDPGASPEEIAKAHRAASETYAPGALASYGLISDEERKMMLGRIESAYRTLADPELRRAYDESGPRTGSPSPRRAVFRRTTQPLEIQDALPKKGFLARLGRLFRGKSKGG